MLCVAMCCWRGKVDQWPCSPGVIFIFWCTILLHSALLSMCLCRALFIPLVLIQLHADISSQNNIFSFLFHFFFNLVNFSLSILFMSYSSNTANRLLCFDVVFRLKTAVLNKSKLNSSFQLTMTIKKKSFFFPQCTYSAIYLMHYIFYQTHP